MCSKKCRREFEHAVQCGKYIIPVLIPEFEEDEEDITDNDKTGWMGPVTSGVYVWIQSAILLSRPPHFYSNLSRQNFWHRATGGTMRCGCARCSSTRTIYRSSGLS